jgi:hypothetical protein
MTNTRCFAAILATDVGRIFALIGDMRKALSIGSRRSVPR